MRNRFDLLKNPDYISDSEEWDEDENEENNADEQPLEDEDLM